MNYFNLKPRYYFGEGAIKGLSIEFKKRQFKKALILYGGGSIKKNGAYDDVVNQLNESNISFVEFSGIEPNPRLETIEKAISFTIENEVDLILAVGGGSVIDASKVIAALAKNRNRYNSAWEYVTNPKQLQQLPIPIISVITLAGTASENNGGSVITNWEKKIKSWCNSRICYTLCFNWRSNLYLYSKQMTNSIRYIWLFFSFIRTIFWTKHFWMNKRNDFCKS